MWVGHALGRGISAGLLLLVSSSSGMVQAQGEPQRNYLPLVLSGSGGDGSCAVTATATATTAVPAVVPVLPTATPRHIAPVVTTSVPTSVPVPTSDAGVDLTDDQTPTATLTPPSLLKPLPGMTVALPPTMATLPSPTTDPMRTSATDPSPRTPPADATGTASVSTTGDPVARPTLVTRTPSLWTPESTITFTPLAFAAPEVVNPLRGLFRWRGNETVPNPSPLPRPAYDAYNRYEWSDLEGTQGVYSFTVIERDIAKAASEGRRFAFRVRAVVGGAGSAVPTYLQSLLRRGWWHDTNNDGAKDTYVPDWNDPIFLDRTEALLQALGNRYDGDPRIAYLDIGIYGNWGEWHMAGFPYPSPSGAQRITLASKQRIIDLHHAAFPRTRLVMLSDDAEALRYALEQSPRIGWRRDSLGVEHFDDVQQDAATWLLLQDRWQTAPVVAEFINPSQQDAQVFVRAREQVLRYHISLVGNGNIATWADLSTTMRDQAVTLGKSAGYRIAPRSMTFPPVLRRGEVFGVRSLWANDGVAPLYEPWDGLLQLRSPTGDVAWEGRLPLNLTTLLPTRTGLGEALVAADARFSVPIDVPAGAYDLVLVVRDTARRLPPLALAITEQHADGSVTVATVVVR